MTILSLCDRTANILLPWRDAGFECLAVDIQHPSGSTFKDGVEFVGADVRTYIPPLNREYWMVMAFPPCTDVAVSGAKHFARKGLTQLIHSLEVLNACKRICEASGTRWFVENPVSVFSSYWRKPDYIIEPYHYCAYLSNPSTEAYTKKTCLWTGNGFVLPPSRPYDGPISKTFIWNGECRQDGLSRGDSRSITPMGFAKAVYEVNKP